MGVSKEIIVTNFRVVLLMLAALSLMAMPDLLLNSEDAGTTFIRNANEIIPNCTVSHHRN
jgi:hypothetical protein